MNSQYNHRSGEFDVYVEQDPFATGCMKTVDYVWTCLVGYTVGCHGSGLKCHKNIENIEKFIISEITGKNRLEKKF